jgi:hypothetical protein
MSWSTMPFQSKPEANPDRAIPAISTNSEGSRKTLEKSQKICKGLLGGLPPRRRGAGDDEP